MNYSNIKLVFSILFFMIWISYGMYLFFGIIIGMDYPILSDEAKYEVDHFHLGIKTLYWIVSIIVYAILYEILREKN